MAAFSFRLERVLELRRRAVEEQQRQLAKVRQAIRAHEARLIALEQEKTTLSRQWRSLAAALTPQMALSFAGFAEELERRTRATQAELAKARENELARCALLQQAMRQQKILEKLKEWALKRYQVEMARREQKGLDEFAATTDRAKRR